jgi:hypothetical protein
MNGDRKTKIASQTVAAFSIKQNNSGREKWVKEGESKWVLEPYF